MKFLVDCKFVESEAEVSGRLKILEYLKQKSLVDKKNLEYLKRKFLVD